MKAQLMASYGLTEDRGISEEVQLRTLAQMEIKISERATDTAFSEGCNYRGGEQISRCLGTGTG